jgi:hypothetical protein
MQYLLRYKNFEMITTMLRKSHKKIFSINFSYKNIFECKTPFAILLFFVPFQRFYRIRRGANLEEQGGIVPLNLVGGWVIDR